MGNQNTELRTDPPPPESSEEEELLYDNIGDKEITEEERNSTVFRAIHKFKDRNVAELFFKKGHLTDYGYCFGDLDIDDAEDHPQLRKVVDKVIEEILPTVREGPVVFEDPTGTHQVRAAKAGTFVPGSNNVYKSNQSNYILSPWQFPDGNFWIVIDTLEYARNFHVEEYNDYMKRMEGWAKETGNTSKSQTLPSWKGQTLS